MRTWSSIFLLSLISFLSAAEGYNLFEEKGKVGLKDHHGEILIPAIYESLGWSNNSFSVIDRVTGYQLNGLWGIINLNNHKLTKATFSALQPGEGSLLLAYKKSKTLHTTTIGIINTAGKEIIPFVYDGLKIISLHVIVFTRSDSKFNYGLIDLSNKKLIPLEYKEIHALGSLRYAVENFQNKVALFAENGKQLTGFMADSISSFHKNYAIIYDQAKQGLIDRDGQIKIEPGLSAIAIKQDGLVTTKQADEWSFLNGQNQLIKKIQCDSIESLEKGIYKLTVGGAIQLVNEQFKPISPATFSALGKFKNNKAIFKQGSKYGIVRKNGVIAIAARFDNLIADGDYLIANQNEYGKDHWSVLDSLGKFMHTKTYQKIEKFNGEFFPVKNYNFWGALNKDGKEIIACVHDSLLQHFNGKLAVKYHAQYGVISLQEDWLITPKPNPIKLIDENHYLEFANPTTFLKSVDGNTIYFTDNKIDVFPDHLREHLPSGSIWIIDLQGRIINREIQPKEYVEKVFSESEGLRAIKKDGRFGFIDSRGRLRIANRYEDVKSFSEQLAAIKIRDKWGFINHEEKIVIQPVYEDVSSFQYGIAIVKQKGFFGAIDKTGKIILYPRYHRLEALSNHRLLINLDGLQGLSDVDGKLLVGPKFSSLIDLDNGYLIVQRDKKFSLLTLHGVSTIPMIYDYLTYDSINNHYLALKKTTWIPVKLP